VKYWYIKCFATFLSSFDDVQPAQIIYENKNQSSLKKNSEEIVSLPISSEELPCTSFDTSLLRTKDPISSSQQHSLKARTIENKEFLIPLKRHFPNFLDECTAQLEIDFEKYQIWRIKS